MHLRRWSVPAFVLILLSSITVSAQRPARRAKTPGIAKPAVQSASAYKGIFEPMNYPDDLRLNSVFFVNENEGWIGADHGILVHTRDGGRSWQPQIGGDANSTENGISGLWFLDRTHGWAAQSNRLLHTRDGQHWIQTGALPNGGSFLFTSERTGVQINWDGIRLTRDGGRTWRLVAQCSAKMQVNGLVQTIGWHPDSVFFVTQRIGYIAGMSGGELGALIILKTTDGGYTWTTSAVPNVSPWSGVGGVFFLNENTGYIRISDGKLWTTSDGGGTWRGIAGTTLAGGIRFADPELGWSFDGQHLSYTTDGGRTWTARDVRFPAAVRDYSLPRRDIAYVIGEHGMIYRYHVVPYDYEVPNGVQAPAMPGYNAQINVGVQRIRRDIVALQAKLNPALVAAGLPPVTTSPIAPASDDTRANSTAALPGDSAAGSAASDVATSASTSASSSGTSDVESGTSASANTVAGSAPQTSADSSAVFSTDAAVDSGATADAGATGSVSSSAELAQPASPAVQNCCASEVNQLQTDVSSFQQQVPAVTSKYRTLNLIIAGVRMAQDLIGKADAFRTTLLAFKKAPNLQSAASVLQDFIAKYDGVRQEVAGGFQNPPPIPETDSGTPAATGSAVVATQVASTGADAGGVPAVDAGSATPPAPTTPSSDSSSSPGAVTQTADKAVQKAKDKVKKSLGGWIPH